MKSLRLFIKSSSIALLGMLTFSCVDDAYDLTKVKDATILKNGVDLPMGYLEVSMDSILKDVNPTLLKVKDGIYTFSIGNTIDMSAVNTALSGFTPSAISNPAPTIVNMLDGTNLSSVPSDVPVGTTSYSGSTSVSLPNFNTSLMNPVDSILLSNTTFTMLATTSSLGGSGLNNAITITCTPVGSAAEYYDVTSHAKINSWTLQANTPKQIGIRVLKPASSSNLQLNCNAVLNVTTAGSVTITAKTMTKISISVAFSAVDFQTVYGKVNYSKLNNTTSFDFGGFGDLVGSNSVISFYDPTIKIYSNSNLGVPIKLNVGMSSENTVTHSTAALSNVNLTMVPAANPTATRANVMTIDQPNNGLANLFKINPNKISMNYDILSDPATSNHFINKNTFLTLSDSVEVPLRFANDLVLSTSSELDNPFADLTKGLPVQDNMKMGFLLDVTNRIPLAIKVKMNALNSMGNSLFIVESDDIRAADGIGVNGFATDTAFTSTKLEFTAEQINKLKDVTAFKVEFVVSATQTTGFVALRPSDYIKIKVAARVSDGVKIEF
ncbi:MAG TPA: hypothetical protein VFP20_10195 [Bacteroidales bacterium]|nr:hypothetical protein [Bacteroidales bacterium]